MAQQQLLRRPLETPLGPEAPASPSPPPPPTAAKPQWKLFHDAFTLGRSSSCGVAIATSEQTRTVSKFHARVFPVHEPEVAAAGVLVQEWMLQDLGSMNGTALSGRELSPREVVALRDGDEIVLASSIRRYGVRMVVQMPDHVHIAVKVLDPSTPEQVITVGLEVPVAPLPQPPATEPTEPPALANTKGEEQADQADPDKDVQANDFSVLPPVETTSNVGGNAASSAETQQKRDEPERFMVCPVCLEYFQASVTLACSHTFCGACVSTWFRSSLSCPHCRERVVTLPVRNRALDDLVQRLVGETEPYRARLVQQQLEQAKEQELEQQYNMPSYPQVFERGWPAEARYSVSLWLGQQFGERRLTSCARLGFTELSIESASVSELMVAAQNLCIDLDDVRVLAETSQRLKIFLHFG